MLMTVHGVAAGVSSIKELELSKPEADGLADALIRIEREYPTTVDPRVLAWVNLAIVGGMIYGTRIVAVRERLKSERAAKRRPDAPPPPAIINPATQAKPADGAPDKPVGWPAEMPWPPGSAKIN